MDATPPFLTLLIGLFAGGFATLLWLRHSQPDSPSRNGRAVEDQAVLRAGLDRLDERLHELSARNASWQGQLAQHVDEVRHSTDTLRRETSGLATALRKPQVRGQWGELHLRRTVELAGMVEHCDFTEQLSQRHEGQLQRPDLVVHLAGQRSLVVDAKVPLDAFLDATTSEEEAQHRAHLQRHARQVRSHIDALGSKSYWRALANSPEFVVLFLPAESFLSAALDADPGLLEHAANRQVVLASPTTLIALLRTVAQGWQQVALAEQTREIHQLGRALHERIGKVGAHLDRLGRSLTGAVDAYNQTVGSLESRVLVTARQFEDLAVSDTPLSSPTAVTDTPRPLTAAEFTDDESVQTVRQIRRGNTSYDASAP